LSVRNGSRKSHVLAKWLPLFAYVLIVGKIGRFVKRLFGLRISIKLNQAISQTCPGIPIFRVFAIHLSNLNPASDK